MIFLAVTALLAVYTLACLGIGDLCLRRGTRVPSSPLVRWSMALLFGEAALAPIWVGLLLAHAFTPVTVGLVVAAGVAAAIPALARSLAPLARQLRHILAGLRSEPWLWRVLAFVTVALALSGATALARYGSLTWDSRAVYFVEAKLFAATHGFAAVPAHEVWLTVTLFGELHAAALMAIGGADAARLFDWVSIIAAVVLLADLAGRAAGDRRASWLAAALVLTTPVVMGTFGAGNVYLYGAALGAAAVHAAVSRRLFVAGVFAGSVFLVKVSNGVVFVPAIVVLVAWQAWSDSSDAARGARNVMRSGVILAAGAMLAVVPHVIRSVALFGDPVAMLRDPLLGGIRQGYSETSGTFWRMVTTYPVTMALSRARGAGFTPLIAAFLPLVIAVGASGRTLSRGADVRRVFVAGLVGLAAFAVYVPPGLVPRFIVTTAVLLFPLLAASAAAASRADRWPFVSRAVPAAAIVAGLVVTLFFATDVIAPIRTAKYLAGQSSEAEREGDGGAYSEPAADLNRIAPAGSRVLALTFFMYWFRPDLIQCASGRVDRPAIDTIMEPADVRLDWAGIAARGFDYLYVDRRYYAGTERALDLSHLPYGVRATKVVDRDSQVVYRLEFGADFPKAIGCRRIGTDTWAVAVSPQ